MLRTLWRGLLLIVVSCVSAGQSRGGTDFLVIENVHRLAVYNKYQQEATLHDRSVIAAFVPMKITKEDGLLSDGFTRCMQVEIGGEVFYLLKDQDGHLSHSGDLGFEQTFRNVVAVHDTVQILNAQAVSLSPIKSPQRYPLHVGERVSRIFSHRNSTYCQMLSDSSMYGWIDFTGKREGKDWKVFTNLVPGGMVIPDIVLQKIRIRVNEVNEVFMKLFSHFNLQTGQQKQAPRWNLDVSSTFVLCVLQAPNSPDDFQQSTLYLAKDIENSTLGADLLVAHTPGRIEVTTKRANESQAR